ncbi:phage terminase small subunit [Muribacter muris]|uniref:phage terminase small subunit n=1 Tax=Muribacter muris TaxID=67855 RepID=UPI00069D7283|nr:phage terminase small subunit [Muribacter muris]
MGRISPARAHFLRVTAENETAQSPQKSLAGLKGYDLVLASLNVHKRSLKQLQSTERKIAFKRQVFPEYQPWIDGALSAGTGAQDTVLMTMLVWAIDIDAFDTALKIARYALFHDLVMPEHFNRTTACVVVEEIAAKATKARETQQPFEANVLVQVNELITAFDADMPDPVRAKLLRELAELIEESEPENALAYYARAIELDGNCGAKGLRSRLEKKLAKLTDSEKTEQ